MSYSMKDSGIGRIRLLSATVVILVVGIGTATVFGDASDPGIANALTRVGSSFGWVVNLIPPGPCFPPGPCKATLNLDIDHRLRPDLNSEIRLVHHKDGQIDPCWKVFSQTDAETGRLSFNFSILDADPADLANATITVPPGFQLVQGDLGHYTLVPMRAGRSSKSRGKPSTE